MDEGRLIQQALAGDASAERALYDAHVERIYRLAFRMAGEPAQAEELTQETFVRAFDRLASFRGEAAFSSWLHAIGFSVAINHLRKRKRQREHERDWEKAFPVHEPGAEDRIELRRRLHRAIEALAGDLRMVFLMHEAEGYRHREIAEILGIPEGTSKARLHQARSQLCAFLGLERRSPAAAREAEASP